MGWTEREKILTSYEEIIKYLEDEDYFHDYRIGNVHYDGSNADITIEEVIPGAKIQDSTGLVWDFHFKDVTSFEMSVDVVMGFWIYEVERGEKPNEIAFNLDSGFLGIAAEQIEFGIPSPEKSVE
ncbi:MAG: hypothetical protein MR537_01390 [Clostridiales bacterium]|nr:hypothetical protein [Clostridiales bacterium]